MGLLLRARPLTPLASDPGWTGRTNPNPNPNHNRAALLVGCCAPKPSSRGYTSGCCAATPPHPTPPHPTRPRRARRRARRAELRSELQEELQVQEELHAEELQAVLQVELRPRVAERAARRSREARCALGTRDTLDLIGSLGRVGSLRSLRSPLRSHLAASPTVSCAPCARHCAHAWLRRIPAAAALSWALHLRLRAATRRLAARPRPLRWRCSRTPPSLRLQLGSRAAAGGRRRASS